MGKNGVYTMGIIHIYSLMEENRSFFIDPLFFVVTFGCSDHVLPGNNPNWESTAEKNGLTPALGITYIL